MGTARLGDFGLMIMTDLSTVLLSNTADPLCGTIRWMSPELLDPTHFGSDGLLSRQSDCYALGMVIYEVNRFLSFRSPLAYVFPGTQRLSAVPSHAVSCHYVCNT